jgi:recombination protein RecA
VATEEARKNAQAILTAINKKHGAGTVVVASSARMKPPRLSTGSLALDVALGGGWPVNQWSEIVGNEGSGKTTITLKTIAAAQKADPSFSVVWVAAESYDEEYAAMLGVDNTRVFLIEENVMEVAYEAVLEFVGNRACDMVVIDSLPALVPADEDNKAMDEWSPGAGARRTNQFMRKATKATKRSLVDDDRPIVGILINQWREKIGVMHGDPRTTPGGKAKNFWMYCRVEVRRDEWLYDGVGAEKEKVGQAIKISTIKMKGARPGQPAVVDFYFADVADIEAGTYDIYKETLNLSLAYDIVERSGNGNRYEDVRYPGGKVGFYSAIREDEELFARVRKEVLDAARGDTVESIAPPEPARKKIRRRT